MNNVVGLLPAAGAASRISGLPKYLLPCPGGFLLDRLACAMAGAGVRDIYIGANRYNVGLIETYAPPACQTYLVQSKNMRGTLMEAGRWHASRPALMAMPDTYYPDLDIFARMLTALDTADVVLGLWRTRPEQRPHLDMCEIDSDFRVLRVDKKPAETALQFAWGAIAWRAPFWFVMDKSQMDIGDCVNDAIQGGLRVKAVLAVGPYWDCGTPEEYFKLASTWNGKHSEGKK